MNKHKEPIRKFMQQHYTDERLAQLLAHARDGKLYYHSCCCFIGVLTADHALKGRLSELTPIEGWNHMLAAKFLPGGFQAEAAYHQLGQPLGTSPELRDDIRRRILIPMIRAEMKRRERARSKESAESLATVAR